MPAVGVLAKQVDGTATLLRVSIILILQKSFPIQECLETQSVEDDFESLGCFDPVGCHQQLKVLQKDVLPI